MCYKLKSGYLILLATLYLVHNAECDIISNLIEEFKEWKEYFSFSEYLNTLKNDATVGDSEDGPETDLLWEDEKDNNAELAKKPAEEDTSTLTNEVLEENKYFYEETNNLKNINQLEDIDTAETVEKKNIEQNQVSEISQNLKLNTGENNLKNTIVESKEVKTETFSKDLHDIPFDENEIIIYNDMVKIELNEEHESNAQKEVIKNKRDNNKPVENNNYDNLNSNKVNADITIKDVISEEKEQDNVCCSPSDQDIYLQGSLSTPKNNVFSEAPIADDVDVLSTSSTLLKCGDGPDLPSSCLKNEDTAYLSDNIETIDKRKTNFVKVEADDSDSEICSTCEENIFSSNKEESDQVLVFDKKHNENDDQYNSNVKTATTEEGNEKNLVDRFDDQVRDESINDKNKEEVEIINVEIS